MDFEQGPIRPPSEAASLLVRVNRNCPWNKCTFCPVYKGSSFETRKLDEIVADIDEMWRCAQAVRERSWALGRGGEVDDHVASDVIRDPSMSHGSKRIALWLYHGGRTVFLQDANAVLNRQEVLLGVLRAIRERFPHVERITSYGRAHTLARKPVEQLAELHAAGLSRIHLGLESGHDPVLELVRKGSTSDDAVTAGQRVKAAGIHLCFYVMPGLGGRALSEGHARESARVVREVDPDRVRLRSLVVHPRTPLSEQVRDGELEPLDDMEMVSEIKLFIDGLEGCTGELVSDHDLNLLMELHGDLASDRARLLATIERFQGLPRDERLLFIVGRRTSLMRRLDDLADPERRLHATRAVQMLELHTGEKDLESAIQSLRQRMV
jgi:biotin synthase-like enzyme